MIVEDSPTVRTLLVHIVEQDPRLQIAAVCSSAEEAIETIDSVAPDVVSMDIRLPGMNGLEATQRIMADRPTPIVVIADSVYDSTLDIAMTALKSGALTVVEKPSGPAAIGYESIAGEIATQLYIMSQVAVIRRREPVLTRTRDASSAADGPTARPRANFVGIAASTGGPPALAEVLGALPVSFPAPVLVVQHIGAPFMEGFAAWLRGQTRLPVKLAEDRETPRAGVVYVAPGDRHLVVAPGGLLRLSSAPPRQSQRPAADVLFSSLAEVAGAKAVGALLTGMGEDGARGLLDMKKAGAFTLAEDETTAVVFGMPGAAARLGAAKELLPLFSIAQRIVEIVPGVER